MSEERRAVGVGERAVTVAAESPPTFTVEDLRRAIEDIEMPRWRRMIAEADDVVVHSSEHIPENRHLYVLDPNHPESFMPPLPVMVLCRPEHESMAHRLVAQIRTRPDSAVPDTESEP